MAPHIRSGRIQIVMAVSHTNLLVCVFLFGNECAVFVLWAICIQNSRCASFARARGVLSPLCSCCGPSSHAMTRARTDKHAGQEIMLTFSAKSATSGSLRVIYLVHVAKHHFIHVLAPMDGSTPQSLQPSSPSPSVSPPADPPYSTLMSSNVEDKRYTPAHCPST